jgi:hypothetical protein
MQHLKTFPFLPSRGASARALPVAAQILIIGDGDDSESDDVNDSGKAAKKMKSGKSGCVNTDDVVEIDEAGLPDGQIQTLNNQQATL